MPQPVRSVDITTNQDTFLVVGVCTVLTIRLQLWATDYPQLGGGNLHIAHLLYGGLFMVITILGLSSFVGRRWRLRGAVLGGVGFGFFIDEVGKFVTKDNDYFFHPVAAIIYIVFLLLFFATRYLQHRQGHPPEEAVANAIDLFADAARPNGLSVRERARALALLDLAPDHPLTPSLRTLIEQTAAVPVSPPSRTRRFVLAMRARYDVAVEGRWFRRILVAVLSVWALVNVLSVLTLVLAVGFKLGHAHHGFESDEIDRLTFVNIASVLSAGVASGYMIAGLLRLRHDDRCGAYRLIERALLITVFVTQLFIFCESSFSAATGMVVAILLLLTVRYMLRQEQRRSPPVTPHPAPRLGGPAVATA